MQGDKHTVCMGDKQTVNKGEKHTLCKGTNTLQGGQTLSFENLSIQGGEIVRDQRPQSGREAPTKPPPEELELGA